MNFLIAIAVAQQAPAPPGSAASAEWQTLVFIVLFFLLFYLILLRPQAKREKEHKKMLQALSKGDEVVTNGGLLGRIIELGDNFIVLELAKGVEVKVQRQAISATVPKGTLKTL